jgi:hypothetical protein
MLRASRQSFSASQLIRVAITAGANGPQMFKNPALASLGSSDHVQPRIKKKKRRIGMGTPRSHRTIQPNFPL